MTTSRGLAVPAQRITAHEAASHIMSTTCQFGVHDFFNNKNAVARAVHADLQWQLELLGLEVLRSPVISFDLELIRW